MSTVLEQTDDAEEGPVFAPRKAKQDTDLDMTPMIDCTFLLLIFFTVGATIEPTSGIELPPARYGVGIDPDQAVIFSLAQRDEEGLADIYLGEGTNGSPLTGDAADQAQAIREAVEEGFISGKRAVMINASRGVLHREVSRVAAAAAEVEDIQLYMSVLESSE
jgi:biopolymer transport protein ExbD